MKPERRGRVGGALLRRAQPGEPAGAGRPAGGPARRLPLLPRQAPAGAGQGGHRARCGGPRRWVRPHPARRRDQRARGGPRGGRAGAGVPVHRDPSAGRAWPRPRSSAAHPAGSPG
ncbi:hypothetical protein [Nocardioides convexus]|uniref:hypothetical protein n=1 Tax=Nocardioides convexus TaxID=2712224 RepID=UPI003101B2CD